MEKKLSIGNVMPVHFQPQILLLAIILILVSPTTTSTTCYGSASPPKVTAIQSGSSQITVTGRVTNAQGDPLPGVSITVKGTRNTGASTDIDGRYKLTAISTTSTLVFTFVGMVTQEVPLAGKSNLNIVLHSSDVKIEEVVVVGYGSARKVGTVVGSVATVKSDKVKDRPTADEDPSDPVPWSCMVEPADGSPDEV